MEIYTKNLYHVCIRCQELAMRPSNAFYALFSKKYHLSFTNVYLLDNDCDTILLGILYPQLSREDNQGNILVVVAAICVYAFLQVLDCISRECVAQKEKR